MVTHTDAKPFQCEICGMKLRNDSGYRKHKINVHGIKIACDICKKAFSAAAGLARHKRRDHNIY